MATLKLELLEVSDEQALTALVSIGRHIEALAQGGLQRLVFECSTLDQENPASYSLSEVFSNLAPITDQHGFFIRQLTTSFALAQGATGIIDFRRTPPGTSTVTLTLSGGYWDSQNSVRTEMSIYFQRQFEAFHRREMFASLAPQISEFYTRRESTVLRLEEITTRAAENTEAHRKMLDEQFERKVQEVEAQLQRRLGELSAEAERATQVLSEKEKALAAREADLEKADNTHARRKLRQDLKDALKERHLKFTLTAETENKRRPVIGAFVSLMTVTLAASLYAGWLASAPVPDGSIPWLPSLRWVLSLAGFAGSIIYFIRWQDRWSQTHADEEFRLKRLDLDVDRASWLVEVLLEWRGENGREIPPELIEKLAYGLFEPGKTSPSVTHPVEDAIASLLASPASLNLKFPGGEASYDKKAIERAKAKTD